METGSISCAVPSVLLAASLLVGCYEAPIGPEVSTEVQLAHLRGPAPELRNLVPFYLDASAALLLQEFAPGFGNPDFGKSDFSGRCSTPSDLLLSFGLAGQATHLGTFTGAVEHCTQVDFQTGASSVTDGLMTLTSANGDELRATYWGAPGPDGLEEYVTFVGGTGRFSSAEGSALARPVCDRSTGTCTFVMDGMIGYKAFNRAGS